MSKSSLDVDERHRKKYIVKDNLYYHGRGNLWNNLSNIPKNRLHLIMRPDIIEKDEEAQRMINTKREQEIDYEYAREDYLGYLAEEDKSKLDHRQAIRQSFEDSIYGPNRIKPTAPKYYKTTSRIEALAQPKNRILPVNGPETPDYVGLVTTSDIAPTIYQSLHNKSTPHTNKYNLDNWIERSKRSSDNASNSNKDDESQIPINELLNEVDREPESDNEYHQQYNNINENTEVIPTKVGTVFVNRTTYPEPNDVICPDLAEKVYDTVSETELEKEDRIEGMNVFFLLIYSMLIHYMNMNHHHLMQEINKEIEIQNQYKIINQMIIIIYIQ